jgi:tetratricopeptide (TPR) repeat protein
VPRSIDRVLPRVAGIAALTATLFVGLAAGAGTTATSGSLPSLVPSPLGHYLAGRHAQVKRDLEAAADLMTFALAADPDNRQLLEASFNLMLSGGRIKEAVALAKRMEQTNTLNGVARVALAVDRVRAGDYKAADRYLDKVSGSGLERFLQPMLQSWTQLKLNGRSAAVAALAPLAQIKGFEPLYEIQCGQIEDVSGQPAEAAKHYDRALEMASDQAFRMIELVANFRARQGDRKGAEALYAGFEQAHPRTFLIQPLRKAMAGGRKPSPLIATPSDGVAEALFNLAVLLQSEASNEAALVLARLALVAHGEDPIYRTLLADILDAQGRSAAALAAYREVPVNSPYGWQAELKIAEEMQRLDRKDEAISYLEKLVDARPDRAEAAIELGDDLRAAKRFAEAAKAYDKAVARLGTLMPEEWSVYYFRGIAYERSDQWPRAEQDFKKALQLQPDQPYVLNYLGYTWVDRGENLQQAIGMLKSAVQQKKNDGFIVDSLAWAYYRLGQYKEAVRYQEQAISLEPADPVLNDHLGDIYWKLGRRTEARFQWQRALTFKPDADKVAPIEAKLQHGLDKASGG